MKIDTATGQRGLAWVIQVLAISSCILALAREVCGVTVPASQSVGGVPSQSGDGLGAAYIDQPATSNLQADSILDTTSDDASFAVSALDYPNGSADVLYLGSAISDLLGSDAFVGARSGDSIQGFVFRFSGFIRIDSAFDSIPGGLIDVAFALGSDDGSRLRIGSIDVVDNGGDHGFGFASGMASFESPGLYPIELIYYNNTFGGGLEWYSSIPGGSDSGAPTSTMGIVPSSILYSTVPSASCGVIVISGDEWVFSNTAFADSETGPSTEQYFQNITSLFASGSTGAFGTYSTDSYGYGSAFVAAFASNGHTHSNGTGFDLPTLLQFDGLFFGGQTTTGYLTPSELDILAQYVAAGGNVYINVGTGQGGAAAESSAWNPFLSAYGITVESTYDGLLQNRIPIDMNADPIFTGVDSLFFHDSQPLLGAPVVQFSDGFGRIAVVRCFATGCPADDYTASANSFYSDQVPANVIDGNVDTVWSAGDYATPTDPNWLIIDLAQLVSIETVRVTGSDTALSQWDSFSVDFSLMGSVDGGSWTTIGTGELVDPPGLDPASPLRLEIFDLGGQGYRYIQIHSTGGEHWTTVNEVVVITAHACSGDLDGDCDSDVLDFGVFASSFGTADHSPFTNGDLDGDGDVDIYDFGVFAADFGCVP